MAKHFAAKKNDDLEMLLADGSQMPWTRTEGGCRKSTLVKALFLTSILLVLVCVSWFLHYSVFMDTSPKRDIDLPVPNPSSAPNGGAGQPGGCPPASNSVPLLDLDKIVVALQTVNLSLIEIPPELTALMIPHMNDFVNRDFQKVFADKALVAVVRKFFRNLHKVLLAQIVPTLSTDHQEVKTTSTPASKVDDVVPTKPAKMAEGSTESMDTNHIQDHNMEKTTESRGIRPNPESLKNDHSSQLDRQHRVE